LQNRDEPLKDSNGILTIHKDGNLVILNKQNGIIIWSTNISISSNSNDSEATLDDSGNLILRD
jgi:outer membrane protein assembly factor BamB